jgi:hypothetical protein
MSTPVVSVIAVLITNRALCQECITTKSHMKPEAFDMALTALSHGVKVDRYANGLCGDCGREGLVYAIDRPPRP